MEVFDAVRTVLAIREYEDKPVPPDALERIVQAAHLTASSRNGQPWHFIVIERRETLDSIAARVPSGPYMAQAPLAVAVAIDDSPYAHSDAGRAIQSMVLTAWAEGIGSNWVGFEGTLDPVNELVGLPEGLRLIAVVCFGYPSVKLGKGKKKRKPIEEIVHRDRFGEPFTVSR